MFEECLALLAKPDRYVCVWRDGELFIEVAQRPERSDEVRCTEHAARGIATGAAASSLHKRRRVNARKPVH